MKLAVADVVVLTTGFPRRAGDHFGTFVLDLARSLVASGLSVAVIAPHEAGLPVAETVDGVVVRRFRYAVRAAGQRLAYGGGIPTNLARRPWLLWQVPWFLLAFWWAALRHARHCQLIHAQWTISGLVGYWAARWWRRPVVLTVRGSDVHVLGSRLGVLNRHVYRRVDRIIAVSADISRRLGERGVPPDKIHIIHNGISDDFRPASQGDARRELGLQGQRAIALFVGLLVPVKGVDVLLEAVARGAGEYQVLIVGDGDSGSELAARAQHLGLGPERVAFVGSKGHDEIPRWLVAADLLVLPSRSEGRPNVVLEAQACGRPVVATRVGGTPELVRHEVDGLLVDADDADGLAAALDRLVVDDALRTRLGKEARRKIVEDGHTWEASARQVRDLYDEVLASRRRA